jgi:hypothetical protein
LQVDFPDGEVSFFQISWQPGAPPVMYEGVSVFETPAEELVEHISGERRDRDYHTFTEAVAADAAVELPAHRPRRRVAQGVGLDGDRDRPPRHRPGGTRRAVTRGESPR